MKKRKTIFVGLILLFLLIGLFVFKTRLSAPNADPAHHRAEKRESLEVQAPGTLPVEPHTTPDTITPKTGPLIANWSEVPCRYASYPAMIGGSGNEGRKSYADIHNTLNWEAKSLEGNLEASDREMRCLGVIQTLDFFLVEAAGLPMKNGWYGAHNPPEYFPKVFGLPEIPSDPAEAERAKGRVLALLSSRDFAAIISRLPDRHRFTGLEEALATRAISMLGAWPSDAQTRSILQAELSGTGSNSRKVAALNAFIMQGEVAEARSWLESIKGDPAALAAAADGLVPPDSRGIPDSDFGSGKGVSFLAAHSGKSRELDDTLLDLFNSSSDPGTRASFATVLAGRVDNERVRQTALEILRIGEPQSILSLLRQRPALNGNVEYAAALKELLKSTDARVATWAVVGLSTSGDPEAWRSIAPLLRHPNRGVAVVAVSLIGKCGRMSKTECGFVIREALAARKSDAEFENLANLALNTLN